MAWTYSTKHFFRQMSNALLVRYFHERGLFAEFDFAGMKEGKIEPLFVNVKIAASVYPCRDLS